MTTVCVYPRPSVVNMTLPLRLLLSAGAYRLTSRAGGRPAANPTHAAAAVDRCDGRTDGQTDARPLRRPCSAYYAGRLNNSIYQRNVNRSLSKLTLVSPLTSEDKT